MGAIIRFISTSTIKPPENPDAIRRVELTPWDLQLLLVGPIQKGLLFPKKHDTNIDALIQHLKSSLSNTLHTFPPLAGRLSSPDDNHHHPTTLFIDCNNAGALFVHAEGSSISKSDILDSVYVPSVIQSLFPLNGTKNYSGGDSNPLLAVQVTELADGIFIGCTINHVVVDGSSFWHFINSWSEISRCGAAAARLISRPPVLNRWFPAGLTPPIRINPQQFPAAGSSSDLINNYPVLKERVFLFEREKVLDLKSRANSETGGVRISSLQALLAHLWRSVTRSRKPDPSQESELRILIGARPRLNLPADYFGNAVQAGVARLKAGELLERNRGFGKAALEMNRVVTWHSEEENLREFLTAWNEKAELLTMEGMTTSRGGGSCHGGLVVSSSPRFDVYGNDFGWGKPVAVRSGGGNKHDGKITVFQGRQEGSVEVQACLLEETLLGMENDSEFRAAVSA